MGGWWGEYSFRCQPVDHGTTGRAMRVSVASTPQRSCIPSKRSSDPSPFLPRVPPSVSVVARKRTSLQGRQSCMVWWKGYSDSAHNQPLHENLRVVGKPATLSARRYDQSGPHVCLLQYNLVKTESCQTSSSRCCHTTTSTVEYARITWPSHWNAPKNPSPWPRPT